MKKFNSINEFNKYLGVEESKHKDIDVGIYDDTNSLRLSSPPVIPNFYRVSLKIDFEDPGVYGKTEFDHSNSFLYFSCPNKPIQWETTKPWQGYYINIMPELIDNHRQLAYNFLDYGAHEALFLTKEEEDRIKTIFDQLLLEYQNPEFSLDTILAYCNLLFSYINRFYLRQFGTRKELYNHIVNNFISCLNEYYNENEDREIHTPSVQYFAEALRITPNYLGDVLKHHTGKSAIEHIHIFLVNEAKRILKSSTDSVSEIAYQLGYDYPTYFSRLFKKETGISPTEYRNQ